MSIVKAICDCKDRSEDDLVLAIKQGRFSWFNDWGFFKIMVTLILLLATDGIWIFFVLGWKLSHIVDPPFLCQFCDSKIEKEQLRG